MYTLITIFCFLGGIISFELVGYYKKGWKMGLFLIVGTLLFLTIFLFTMNDILLEARRMKIN